MCHALCKTARRPDLIKEAWQSSISVHVKEALLRHWCCLLLAKGEHSSAFSRLDSQTGGGALSTAANHSIAQQVQGRGSREGALWPPACPSSWRASGAWSDALRTLTTPLQPLQLLSSRKWTPNKQAGTSASMSKHEMPRRQEVVCVVLPKVLCEAL